MRQSKQIQYKQFAVKASYAKQAKPQTYYVWATSRSEAKRRFILKFPWLTCISSLTEDYTDISNPYDYIVVRPLLVYKGLRFSDCKTVQELNERLKRLLEEGEEK